MITHPLGTRGEILRDCSTTTRSCESPVSSDSSISVKVSGKVNFVTGRSERNIRPRSSVTVLPPRLLGITISLSEPKYSIIAASSPDMVYLKYPSEYTVSADIEKGRRESSRSDSSSNDVVLMHLFIFDFILFSPNHIKNKKDGRLSPAILPRIRDI